jgi:hypothetical protein
MQPASEVTEQSKPNGPRDPATVEHGPNGSAVLYDLLQALQAMRVGDFSIRMPVGGEGIEGKIADTFNEIVAANEVLAKSLVGRAGPASASNWGSPTEPGVRWRHRSTH